MVFVLCFALGLLAPQKSLAAPCLKSLTVQTDASGSAIGAIATVRDIGVILNDKNLRELERPDARHIAAYARNATAVNTSSGGRVQSNIVWKHPTYYGRSAPSGTGVGNMTPRAT